MQRVAAAPDAGGRIVDQRRRRRCCAAGCPRSAATPPSRSASGRRPCRPRPRAASACRDRCCCRRTESPTTRPAAGWPRSGTACRAPATADGGPRPHRSPFRCIAGMLSFSDHGQRMAAISAASSAAVSDWSQVCTASRRRRRTPRWTGSLPSSGSFRNEPVKPRAGDGIDALAMDAGGGRLAAVAARPRRYANAPRCQATPWASRCQAPSFSPLPALDWPVTRIWMPLRAPSVQRAS